MLYVIGLYRIPPRGGPEPVPGSFLWVRLTEGLRTAASAQYHLALWRDVPTYELGGQTWYAVYRMIVGRSRLAWYGLSADGESSAQHLPGLEGER